jgi:diacylglycerol O-acyltransferase / wax synthase
MQQLTTTDTAFLTMETATQFGHVASVYMYEPGAGFEETVTQLEERLHLLPPYRRQLVEVPFDLDRPYWIESPNFDLDFHLRHLALPPPGTREQLAEQVARLAARPLDRTRPLWEWYVIEGLQSGEVAHFVKLHHATIDGASGTEMMSVLLKDHPEADPPAPPAEPWKPEPLPTSADLMTRTMFNLASQPGRMAQAQMRLWREMMERARTEGGGSNLPFGLPSWDAMSNVWNTRGDGGGQTPALPTVAAPRTPFNASITAHRRWSYLTVPLDDIKRIKHHFEVTVNDVVLAVCAGALRRWLQERNALPSEPLVAMCPVSIRTGQETDKYSNRVSGMVASLATDVADPVERLRTINRSTTAAKAQFQAIPADALQDFGQFTPPALMAQASRLLAETRIADRMNPPINVTISNVPGPRHPLYLGRSMLKHNYPCSMVTDGMGLNMTCTSYMDNLDFGLIACRELIPDLWKLNDALCDAVAELLAKAG